MENKEKTLRDEIAMSALNGMLSKGDGDSVFFKNWVKHYSNLAYKYADEMMKAREVKND